MHVMPTSRAGIRRAWIARITIAIVLRREKGTCVGEPRTHTATPCGERKGLDVGERVVSVQSSRGAGLDAGLDAGCRAPGVGAGKHTMLWSAIASRMNTKLDCIESCSPTCRVGSRVSHYLCALSLTFVCSFVLVSVNFVS